VRPQKYRLGKLTLVANYQLVRPKSTKSYSAGKGVQICLLNPARKRCDLFRHAKKPIRIRNVLGRKLTVRESRYVAYGFPRLDGIIYGNEILAAANPPARTFRFKLATIQSLHLFVGA
jgi:hypothetical protein